MRQVMSKVFKLWDVFEHDHLCSVIVNQINNFKKYSNDTGNFAFPEDVIKANTRTYAPG